jgi:hypothetical protein
MEVSYGSLITSPRLLRRPPHAGGGLVGLVAAAVALIGVALLVIPTVSRRPLELAPLSTPKGVVQHFYDAIYRGNYGTAYALLSDQTQRDMPLEGFQGYANFNRESEMRVDAVEVNNATATVTITVTHFEPGGIFGGNDWSYESKVLLEREGDSWRIIGLPG